MEEYYIKENSRFDAARWTFYDRSLDPISLISTNNGSESINACLNDYIPKRGKVELKKVVEILVDFHRNSMNTYWTNNETGKLRLSTKRTICSNILFRKKMRDFGAYLDKRSADYEPDRTIDYISDLGRTKLEYQEICKNAKSFYDWIKYWGRNLHGKPYEQYDII